MQKQTREPLSFMEALEAELRKEIRAELLAEFGGGEALDAATPAPSPTLSAAERMELWLSANSGVRVFKNTRKQEYKGGTSNFDNSHAARAPAPVTQPTVLDAVREAVIAAQGFVDDAVKPAVRPAHELDVMDIAALEFFRRNGVSLRENFDESDLKSAYRKLALKFHPDRHANASAFERKRCGELFSQASEQTKRLSRHFSTAQAA